MDFNTLMFWVVGWLERFTNSHLEIHSEPGRAYNPPEEVKNFYRSLQEPVLPPLPTEQPRITAKQEILRETLKARMAERIN